MNMTQMALLSVCFAYANTITSMDDFNTRGNPHAQTKPIAIPSRCTKQHESSFYVDSPCGNGRSTSPGSCSNSPMGTPPASQHSHNTDHSFSDLP